MRRTKRDGLMLAMGVLLTGCAGMAYNYYTMDIPDGCYKDGKLLAHDPKDDLSMEVCRPTADNHMPCIVRKSDLDEKLQADFAKCQVDLIACQQSKAQ